VKLGGCSRQLPVPAAQEAVAVLYGLLQLHGARMAASSAGRAAIVATADAMLATLHARSRRLLLQADGLQSCACPRLCIAAAVFVLVAVSLLTAMSACRRLQLFRSAWPCSRWSSLRSGYELGKGVLCNKWSHGPQLKGGTTSEPAALPRSARSRHRRPWQRQPRRWRPQPGCQTRRPRGWRPSSPPA